MEKQLIWVFEWRKSVHYWWSYILFSPGCKELTSMLDPLLYRWGVPPVVIRCVHWTMQMGVLLTLIMAQSTDIVMPSAYPDSRLADETCPAHVFHVLYMPTSVWKKKSFSYQHHINCSQDAQFPNFTPKGSTIQLEQQAPQAKEKEYRLRQV